MTIGAVVVVVGAGVGAGVVVGGGATVVVGGGATVVVGGGRVVGAGVVVVVTGDTKLPIKASRLSIKKDLQWPRMY